MCIHSVIYSPRNVMRQPKRVNADDVRLPTMEEYKARRQRLWSRGVVSPALPPPPPIDAIEHYCVAYSSYDEPIYLPKIPLIHRHIETPRDRTMDIIREVATEHGLRVCDVIGPRRMKRLVSARFKAIYRVANERPDLSLPAIAKIFGNRDHTSILHALRAYADRNGLPQLVDTWA